jgi:hypothetical protein
VLAGLQRSAREVDVGVVGRGDHHHVDPRPREHLLDGADVRLRQVHMHLCGIARPDHREPKPRYTRDQRRVEGSASIPIA